MRMKKGMVTALAVIGMAALAGYSVQAGNENAAQAKVKASGEMQTAALNEPAPDFTLTDANGKTHSLSDFAGKYVVLEWINFDCPFVKAQYNSGNMPALQQKYTAEGAIWLSICSSAPDKQGHFSGSALTKRIADENSHATAYLVDSDGAVGRMYKAKTTPHMFVINPKGVLVYAGAIDSKPTTDPEAVKSSTNYVAAALDASMAGKAIEVPTSQPYGCSVKY